MYDPATVASSHSEDAIGDIRLIHRDYANSRAVAVKPPGRFQGPEITSDRSTQLAIAAIAAVVEQYAAAVLLDAAVATAKKALGDWDDKGKAWNTTFGVHPDQASVHFPAMIGFYQARTAVLHERGHLTRAQRTEPRKSRVDAALAHAGLSRQGHRLILTAETVAHCAAVCCATISELEATRLATAPSMGQQQPQI